MDWKVVERNRGRLKREQGAVVKDWGGRIPVALIYPNSYFVGMSNLGIHAIYRLINSDSRFVCERVFCEPDESPPLSLESQRPLSDFAVLAFSLSFELDYLNIPYILKSSGLPVYAADRDERYPLVIAGGACISTNPVPVAPFFDCLAIGEAEAMLPAMLELFHRGIPGPRQALLEELVKTPGIYVPAITQASVSRQRAANLDGFAVTSTVLTTDTELGNLYLIEVERGCNRACRFCLVGSTYRPFRCRSLENLVAQARYGLRFGKRLGLVGPAVTAHPDIEELLDSLYRMGAEVSVSSLRARPLPASLLDKLARGKAETFAIAPEAGSERLRRLIGKGISEDDILAAVENSAGAGARQIKLYFIAGLPTETDDDIEAIIALGEQCKERLDRKRSGCRMTLNIAPFVPKAGTPFERQPMAPVRVLEKRLARIKGALTPKGLQVHFESPAWSEVQAVLSRGDAGVADILVNLEKRSLAGWRRASRTCKFDTDTFAHSEWGKSETLPWAFISSASE